MDDAAKRAYIDQRLEAIKRALAVTRMQRRGQNWRDGFAVCATVTVVRFYIMLHLTVAVKCQLGAVYSGLSKSKDISGYIKYSLLFTILIASRTLSL